MLVAAVHGIAGLEGGDHRPAALEEHGARLGGADVEVGIFGRVLAFAQHHHPAGQVDLALRQHLRHARMLRIGGAVDVLGLELLVDRILLAHLHDGEDLAGLAVDERDLLFVVDAVGKLPCRPDSVIGIGQNTPFASFMSRHEPRQSSWPMKPSSGV